MRTKSHFHISFISWYDLFKLQPEMLHINVSGPYCIHAWPRAMQFSLFQKVLFLKQNLNFQKKKSRNEHTSWNLYQYQEIKNFEQSIWRWFIFLVFKKLEYLPEYQTRIFYNSTDLLFEKRTNLCFRSVISEMRLASRICAAITASLSCWIRLLPPLQPLLNSTCHRHSVLPSPCNADIFRKLALISIYYKQLALVSISVELVGRLNQWLCFVTVQPRFVLWPKSNKLNIL